MAIVADFEEEEASVIRSLRCILFIFVSVPPASLLYKYLEYMSDDGPYQSTIGLAWFLSNLITVSILIYVEFFGLKLERLSTKLYYYTTTLTLCGVSDCLSVILFRNLLPQHRKDIQPYIHTFWILGAILYNLLNIFNHLVLIYDTITSIESRQKRSLQIAKLRVSFYVIFIILSIGNLFIMFCNPAVRLRELITANIILWSTLMIGTSMLTLKIDDCEEMKQHKLINFFRSYSIFTNLKTGMIIFVTLLLIYSVPVLIRNDIADPSPDPQLEQKIYTYLPLMAWIFVFSFVRDACLMQRINQFWTKDDMILSDETTAIDRKTRRRLIFSKKRLRTIHE